MKACYLNLKNNLKKKVGPGCEVQAKFFGLDSCLSIFLFSFCLSAFSLSFWYHTQMFTKS